MAEPMGSPEKQHRGAGVQQWSHNASPDLVSKPRQSRGASQM